MLGELGSSAPLVMVTWRVQMSVSYEPGSTNTTRMPSECSSMRNDSLQPSRANFELQALRSGLPARPETEATCVICPDFCCRVAEMTALLIATTPNKLASNWRRNSSGDIPSATPAGAGVVDQHVDATVIFDDRFRGCRDGFESGDVELTKVDPLPYIGLFWPASSRRRPRPGSCIVATTR